jgi:hypothetical protein
MVTKATHSGGDRNRLLLPHHLIAAVFAVYISDDVQFGEFHIQPVVDQQSVSQQRADSGEILDDFRGLDCPDNCRRRAEHRKFGFRRPAA